MTYALGSRSPSLSGCVLPFARRAKKSCASRLSSLLFGFISRYVSELHAPSPPSPDPWFALAYRGGGRLYVSECSALWRGVWTLGGTTSWRLVSCSYFAPCPSLSQCLARFVMATAITTGPTSRVFLPGGSPPLVLDKEERLLKGTRCRSTSESRSSCVAPGH